MKILFLTRYNRTAASSRYRVYQYLPFLSKAGIIFDVHPLLGDSYLQYLYSGRSFPLLEIIKSYFKRAIVLLKKNRYDLIWIEAEPFPWIPGWLGRTLLGKKMSYIVDYDDAAFHRYDLNENPVIRWLFRGKIEGLMSRAAVVIVGNRYLAEWAKEAGAKRIALIPTVVDIKRYPYPNHSDVPKNEMITIGWIGTPWSSRYLEEIKITLINICEKRNAKVVFIGAKESQFSSECFQIKPWSESTEIDDITKFDIGIMPLSDSPWERGKCGLKLIQYMACGLPIVGTPIGVNREIILDGINGFQAATPEEWFRVLETLIENEPLRKKMGQAGRKMAEEKYSLQVTLPELAKIIQSAQK